MKPFHLAWFTWHGAQDWTDPSWGPMSWADPAVIVEMAKVLEDRGLFDMIVFADVNAVADEYGRSNDVYIKYGLEGTMHDPVPMSSILAQATGRIGLIPTLNTSVWPAHLISRTLHSLDHLSGHRLGWNVVTGASRPASANFGLAPVPHDRRYDLAEEYLRTCRGLWSAWKQTPDDGRPGPVIMQAGGSDRGRDFAALNAEIVVTHQNSVAEMKAFHDDMKSRAQKFGRAADDIKIFFTIKPIIGATDDDAEAERLALTDSPEISVEIGLARFSTRIGVDLSVYDVDKPLDQDTPGQHTGSTAGQSLSMFRQYYRDGQAPLLRDVAISEALKETTIVQGSGTTVATRMIEIMDEVGGDGFAVRGALSPRKVAAMVDRVVPELQRRGAVRGAYAGTTLREHLAQY